MQQAKPTVSVILPTYNESGNIVRLVEAIQTSIPPQYAAEIIVVDDNSPDGTYALVAERFAGDPIVVPVLRTRDRGFANSIRAGIEKSTGQKIVVMDTDFTHDPAEIPRLLHISQIYDLVSGSRFCSGGSMQDTWHYLSSLMYNWMLRLLLRTQVQDNLGGYFVIDRKAMFSLPFDAIFYGYGDYYFRLLYFYLRRGYSLVEIPAKYAVRTAGRSKSRFMKMLFTYFFEAIKVRFHRRRLEKLGCSPEIGKRR